MGGGGGEYNVYNEEEGMGGGCNVMDKKHIRKIFSAPAGDGSKDVGGRERWAGSEGLGDLSISRMHRLNIYIYIYRERERELGWGQGWNT